MTSFHTHCGSVLAMVVFAMLLLGAAALDHDLLLAMPLTLLLASIFGAVDFFAGKRDRWPIFAILGGTIGWIGSIAVLMNLEI